MISNLDPKKIIGAKKLAYVNLPASFLAETARAINTGADKYGRYNWQKSNVELLTYINAIMRHCQLLLAGQNEASDSGIHHAAHIAATCAVIIDAMYHNTLIDNREFFNQEALMKLEVLLNDPTIK